MLDDLEKLIYMRIFDCDDTDTCSLLMEHYKVSDVVIIETAGEIAKTILGKYQLLEKENHEPIPV